VKGVGVHKDTIHVENHGGGRGCVRVRV
jgi:hypothetical protein